LLARCRLRNVRTHFLDVLAKLCHDHPPDPESLCEHKVETRLAKKNKGLGINSFRDT
jgi:hypothetical protein